MNILMFSINPIFPNLITGGASKHLKNISEHIGNLGHFVKILCTRAQDNTKPFYWSENVYVDPILPLKQPFPNPYSISPGELTIIAELIDRDIGDFDRFYIHDGELLLPFLTQKIPTVISFRDNIYPESILGSFISRPDEIIAVSNYSASVIMHTAGRLFPQILNRIHIVKNGIDFLLFKPKKPGEILDYLDIDPENDVILLHPHRPEKSKGLEETLLVANLLVKIYKLLRLRVLVPEWIPDMASDLDKKFYKNIRKKIRELGLENNFVFHKWLPQRLMPEYYSLGRVTLCPGNFIEAFGNVAYESLACGTPSIVANVGVHRTLLGDQKIFKVDHGDVDKIAEIANNIIVNNIRYSQSEITDLASVFALEFQKSEYEKIIISANKKEEMAFNPIRINRSTLFQLAPWCYLTRKGIYHDYMMKYIQCSKLEKLINNFGNKIDFQRLNASNEIIWEDILNWYKQTLITPIRFDT